MLKRTTLADQSSRAAPSYQHQSDVIQVLELSCPGRLGLSKQSAVEGVSGFGPTCGNAGDSSHG